MSDLHTVPGSALPPLVWHHRHADDPAHLTERFRPPLFDGWRSKPTGGLWTTPLLEREGRRHSAWAPWPCRLRRAPDPYTSLVHPDPDARFAVIDSRQDAVAFAAVFTPGPVLAGLRAAPAPEPALPPLTEAEAADPLLAELWAEHTARRARPIADFSRVTEQGLAGVYVTGGGLAACGTPDHGREGVPDLGMWDVPTVWFAVPALGLSSTEPWADR